MALLFEPRFELFRYPEEDTGADAWDPAHVGFQARIRVNPSGAELRHEQKLLAAIATDDGGEEAYLRYVAPRVIEWNLSVRDDEGNVRDVPAPGADGGTWEAFYELPSDLMTWVVSSVHLAHIPKVRSLLTGGGAPSTSGAGATGTTSGQTPPTLTETPQTNSETP